MQKRCPVCIKVMISNKVASKKKMLYLLKYGIQSNDTWICDSGVFGLYCESSEGILIMTDNEERITEVIANE
jgi:hypothetical protein